MDVCTGAGLDGSVCRGTVHTGAAHVCAGAVLDGSCMCRCPRGSMWVLGALGRFSLWGTGSHHTIEVIIPPLYRCPLHPACLSLPEHMQAVPGLPAPRGPKSVPGSKP